MRCRLSQVLRVICRLEHAPRAYAVNYVGLGKMQLESIQTLFNQTQLMLDVVFFTFITIV